MAQVPTVPVYDWQQNGQSVGCGTAVELQHWKDEGVFDASMSLGAIICHEPAAEDDRRRAAWAKETNRKAG